MAKNKKLMYNQKEVAIIQYIGANVSYMAMKYINSGDYVDGNPIVCDKETNTIPLSYHKNKNQH